MTEHDEKPDLDPRKDARDTPPWLMPVSEEETVEETGFSMQKIIAGGAIVFVAASVAGLIYLYHQYQTGDQPPRRIAADTSPVKVRPENPGGMNIPDQDKKIFDQMQGRGGTSGKVNITKQPEQPVAKLPDNQKDAALQVPKDKVVADPQKTASKAVTQSKDKSDVQQPVLKKQTPAEKSKPKAKAKTQPKPAVKAGTEGYDFYRVQLGSFLTERTAKNAWRQVRRNHSNLTKDMQDYISQAVVSGKTYYRLSIGPLDNRTAADNTCLYFKTRGQACFVVSPTKK